MIASLRGILQEKAEGEAVIEVGGVGYRVAFSTLTLGRLPADGQPVHVRVRTVVREDAFELFGFLTRAEEDLFLLLTSVSHVGPRMALAVLSGMEVGELVAALGRGEVARLTKIHGVGKKTAERLVLELKEKVKLVHLEQTAAAASSGALGDLVSALMNLGFKQPQAGKAAAEASAKLGPEADLEALLREALKLMRASA